MEKILIAADDKAMRVFLDRALSRSGHEVDAVPSGDTAARYVAKEAFDVLVMDIDMLGLNGVDLARQVLARTPCQAILFVTGFAAQAMKATDVLPAVRTSCRNLSPFRNSFLMLKGSWRAVPRPPERPRNFAVPAKPCIRALNEYNRFPQGRVAQRESTTLTS